MAPSVDVQAAAGQLERLNELAQAFLVTSFHDEVHGVLTVDDGLALDLQPVLPDSLVGSGDSKAWRPYWDPEQGNSQLRADVAQ